MANYFIASDNINIFPAARSGKYENAYRLSEQTITELIRSLLSNQDGFVIGNHGWNSASEPTTFSFILGGYLISFESSEFTNIIPENTTDPIWACLYRTAGSLNNLSDNSKALDSGDPAQFEGVIFISSERRPVISSESGSIDYSYALKILEKAGDTWRIPENSKLQFTTSANTRAIKIDDGDLTNYDN